MSEPSSDDEGSSRKKNTYSKAFEAFWLGYPRTPNMSKLKAFDGWKKLTEAERKACHDAVPAYRSFLASKADHPVMHATTFINERRFEGFVEIATSSPARAVTDDDWRKRLAFGREKHLWHVESWGPFPGAADCRVPEQLLQPSDGQGWTVWEA
jgi:hypothetical protein